MKLYENQMPFVEQYAHEALALARHTGDQYILAKALTALGLMHQTRGNLHEANRHMEESLQISRREGYRDALAQNLLWLNCQAYWQGRFPHAVELGQQSIAVSREVYDGYSELMNLAFFCLEYGSWGDYAQAFTTLHEGMTKAKERDNIYFLGRLVNSRGWLHSELGDVSRALEYDHESTEIGRSRGIPNVEISALVNLGLNYLALDQLDRARSYLEPTLDRVEREALGSHSGDGRYGSSSDLPSCPTPQAPMTKPYAMLKRDSTKRRRRPRRSISPKVGPYAARLWPSWGIALRREPRSSAPSPLPSSCRARLSSIPLLMTLGSGTKQSDRSSRPQPCMARPKPPSSAW